MPPQVEIHVPISPTKSFFRQIHYLAVSLQRHGGVLRDAPIIVTVGDDCEPYDLYGRLPWTRHYPIEFRWTPRRLYQEHSYFATIVERYCYTFRSPYVLLLDADLVVARPLDDLLARVAAEPAVCATMAIASPWGNSGLLDVHSDEEWWRLAFEAAGLGAPSFDCEYLGYGVLFTDWVRRCPPYLNQGVIAAPSSLMEKVGEVMYAEMEAANRTARLFYRVQIALTFALLRTKLPWRALPFRYNYLPALGPYATAMPQEWADARIIHYGNAKWLEKDRLMTTPGAMDEWLTQPSEDAVQAYCRGLFGELHTEVLRGAPEP